MSHKVRYNQRQNVKERILLNSSTNLKQKFQTVKYFSINFS